MSDEDDAADGEDEITVCPECDSSSIEPCVKTNWAGTVAEDDWRCKSCYAHFNEPDTRDRNHPAVLHGLARELAEGDPSDFGLGGENA